LGAPASPVGKAWCLRFEFWPGIPRRDWVTRTRTEDTTPARVLMRVLIDDQTSQGASCDSNRSLVGRPFPASVRAKRTSVTAQAPGHAACWPHARAGRTCSLRPGNQARAQHRRGRLRVVLSGSVRHGDWAVARERFGGGAGVCEAARPRRRTFQFLEVAQCWARGVTGVGISCNV
jgi:hypothetical protein